MTFFLLPVDPGSETGLPVFPSLFVQPALSFFSFFRPSFPPPTPPSFSLVFDIDPVSFGPFFPPRSVCLWKVLRHPSPLLFLSVVRRILDPALIGRFYSSCLLPSSQNRGLPSSSLTLILSNLLRAGERNPPPTSSRPAPSLAGEDCAPQCRPVFPEFLHVAPVLFSRVGVFMLFQGREFFPQEFPVLLFFFPTLVREPRYCFTVQIKFLRTPLLSFPLFRFPRSQIPSLPPLLHSGAASV